MNKVNDYAPQPIDNRQKVRQHRANNTTSFSRYSIRHFPNTRTFSTLHLHNSSEKESHIAHQSKGIIQQ